MGIKVFGTGRATRDQRTTNPFQPFHLFVPRTFFASPLRHASLWLCSGLLLLLPLTPVVAQKRAAEAKEADRARRAAAVELIVETAEAAREFKDLFYRARVQTLAADALWPHDQTRARAIFRRAWEAAAASDKAEQEMEERESGVPTALPVTEARDEVLSKAAARDAELAEAFLKELLKEKQADEKSAAEDGAASRHRTPWRELSPTSERRLALAYELLKRQEPERAADLMAPVTREGASADLITFIIHLGEQSASSAETIYARLLERVRADRRSDANDVLLLSAPLLSPRLLVVVDARGALQFRPVQLATPEAVTFGRPATRTAFYTIAADILLRPHVPRGSASDAAEAIALYYAIGRLMPSFEREAARHLSALRLRSSTLVNEIEAARRETLTSQFELSSLTPPRPGDPLRSQLDQLGRAQGSLERDRIALGIVRRAAQLRLWDRAKRAAAEIEDLSQRRAALSFIAVNQIADLLRAFADDKEENFEGLARFVRYADVPPLASAWGFAQTAVIAARQGKLERARQLLDEAEAHAARTAAGTRERVAAYTAVARLAARFDLKRAWELLPEVVRAANSVETLAGDESSLDIELDTSALAEGSEPLSVASDVFRLDVLFATLAVQDYEKALGAARSLGKQLPQAFVSLAIARIRLNGRMQNSELRRKKIVFSFQFLAFSCQKKECYGLL